MLFEIVKKSTVEISVEEITKLEEAIAILEELRLKMKAENLAFVTDYYGVEFCATELVDAINVLTQLARGGDEDGKLELF